MFFTFLRVAVLSASLAVLGVCFSSLTSTAMNSSFELDSRTLERAGSPAPVATPVARKVFRKRSHSRRFARASAASKARGRRGRRRAARVFRASTRTLSPKAPSGELSGRETVLRVTDLLTALVPQAGDIRPLALQSSTFSLALDPQRYPVFSAMDGAKIVLDPNASVSVLVKSLITEQDPSVRIISESPDNGRHFLVAILNAAGFHSMEENAFIDFGLDPRLRVHSDFKVEKTSDSLIKQDVALINSRRDALPPALTAFLKKEGFATYEPFASPKVPVTTVSPLRAVIQVSDKRGIDVADVILDALSISCRNDYPVEVFAGENNGISLSIKAQRYFERNGQRFVIAGFDGSPASDSLFRILGARGYRVILLDKHDDFRKVSEKLLTSLRLPSHYAQQAMWPEANSNYSVHMSGFKLEGAEIPGGSVFLTDLRISRVIRDLLVENGFDVRDK